MFEQLKRSDVSGGFVIAKQHIYQKTYATMNKSNVIQLQGRAGSIDPLTDLMRAGARQLLRQAIEAEVQN